MFYSIIKITNSYWKRDQEASFLLPTGALSFFLKADLRGGGAAGLPVEEATAAAFCLNCSTVGNAASAETTSRFSPRGRLADEGGIGTAPALLAEASVCVLLLLLLSTPALSILERERFFASAPGPAFSDDGARATATAAAPAESDFLYFGAAAGAGATATTPSSA